MFGLLVLFLAFRLRCWGLCVCLVVVASGDFRWFYLRMAVWVVFGGVCGLLLLVV